MQTEKENLNANTRRYYAVCTVKNGIKKVFASWRCAAVFLGTLILAILLFANWVHISPEYTTGILKFCAPFLFFFVAVFTLFALGYVKESARFYKNFVRVGFVNNAAEAPILIGRKREDGITVFTFRSKGLVLPFWKDNLEKAQSALNMTIASIRQGNDHQTILVRAVPPNTVLGKTIMWDPKYMDNSHESVVVLGQNIAGEKVTVDTDKQAMALIAGSTGSGKTRLALCWLIQAIHNGAKVYVVDFKGLDFRALEKRDATVLTDPNLILDVLRDISDTIKDRLERFAAVGATNYAEYVKITGDDQVRRIILFVDECAMLTNYGVSKEAKKFSEEVVDLLSGIVRVGRAVAVNVLISTQRPDQFAVPGPIKSNLDVRIVGKCDATLSTMVLGDGRASELIPPDSQGRFVLNDLEDTVFQAFYFDE